MSRALIVEADGGSRGNPGVAGRTVDRRLEAPRELLGEIAAADVATDDEPRPAVVTDGQRAADPTRVVFVRHGVTAFTEQARLDGRGGSDPALSPTGQAQARSAAANVLALVGPGGATVVTSSLARARETGAAVAAAIAVSPQADPAWDEQGFGDWDGLSIPELIDRDPQAYDRLRTDPDYARPGGESWRQLQARVIPAWAALLESEGTTVVVCHRKVILAVVAHVLDLTPAAAWHVATAPGSLTALERLPHGGLSIAFTNRF